MQLKIDISKYEDMYGTFDKAHDHRHMEEVRNFGLKLGEKYAPEKLELIWVAGTLHDIGLSVSRENHELHGYEIIKNDPEIKKAYTEDEFSQILEAIKEHRASSGNPQGIVAKIVSDSDKVSENSNRTLRRACEWGEKHFPEINHPGQLMRAAYHLHEKFGPNGTGTRLYFDESKKTQASLYKPIFEALQNGDLEALENIYQGQ